MRKYIRFLDQIQDGVDSELLEFHAGNVKFSDNRYVIADAQYGAVQTFSIGQPVFNKKGDVLGYLGIGCYENLNYSTKGGLRIPREFWQICLPTIACIEGEGTEVYTYWQNKKGKRGKG